MSRCKNALLNVGVFPIRDHYYEPQFNHRNTKQAFSEDRNLQGINWNISDQLTLLKSLAFSQELVDIPLNKPAPLTFYMNNGSFAAGDAEYWYQIIRQIKPKRIYEIGSGNSTLMAINAIKKIKKTTQAIHVGTFVLSLTKCLGLKKLVYL